MIQHHRLSAETLHRLESLGPLLASDSRVLFAYIFGGLAAGLPRPLSDLDIAVYLDEYTNKAQLKLEMLGILSDALKTDEIDLVILNDAPLSLVGRIMKKKRLLTDKQPFLRHCFESRVLREFFDFSRKEQEILHRRFADG